MASDGSYRGRGISELLVRGRRPSKNSPSALPSRAIGRCRRVVAFARSPTRRARAPQRRGPRTSTRTALVTSPAPRITRGEVIGGSGGDVEGEIVADDALRVLRRRGHSKAARYPRQEARPQPGTLLRSQRRARADRAAAQIKIGDRWVSTPVVHHPGDSKPDGLLWADAFAKGRARPPPRGRSGG